MRASLIVLLSLLALAPPALSRSRALGHRAAPWHSPVCSATSGLEAFGFLAGDSVIRGTHRERYDTWTVALATGVAANVLYATRSDGTIHQSVNAGCTWSAIASAPDLLLDTSNEILARHFDRVYVYTKRHIVRLTYGAVETFRLPEPVVQVEVNRSGSLHLRAIARTGVVYESHDGAATWTRIGAIGRGDVEVSTFAARSFDVMLAWTGAGHQVVISADGGKTWKSTGSHWSYVEAIEVSAADASVIWVSGREPAATRSGLHRSIDGGQTFRLAFRWTQEFSHSLGRLASHPRDSRVVAVPFFIGVGIVTDDELTFRNVSSATQQVEWSPAGTLYFLDLAFR